MSLLVALKNWREPCVCEWDLMKWEESRDFALGLLSAWMVREWLRGAHFYTDCHACPQVIWSTYPEDILFFSSSGGHISHLRVFCMLVGERKNVFSSICRLSVNPLFKPVTWNLSCIISIVSESPKANLFSCWLYFIDILSCGSPHLSPIRLQICSSVFWHAETL